MMLKKVKSENLDFTKIVKCSRALCFVTGLVYCNMSYAQQDATPTDDDQITASASVVASATLTTDANLLFTTYDGTQNDKTVIFKVNATTGTDYDVGLTLGDNAVSTQRYMKNANTSDTLSYDLYQTAARTGNQWDDDTNKLANQIGIGDNQDITVYARMISGQTLVVGSYSDTVTVNVYFNN